MVAAMLDAEQIARYHRDGYVVLLRSVDRSGANTCQPRPVTAEVAR